MITVAGEALVDLVPAGHDEDLLAVRPGGSPFNVALALARLEVDVAMLTRLSSDPFGRRLRTRLASEGVDVRWVVDGDEPTALAVVAVDDGGAASYTFHWEATADRHLGATDLPDDLGAAAALHVGSVSLVLEPAADVYAELAHREAQRRVVTFDPNVRPSFLDTEAIRRLQAVAAISHVVKASTQDVALLGFGGGDDAASRWLAAGTQVVVVTDGAGGARGWTAAGSVEVSSPAVAVVDTIGAGDAFMAGLLTALHDTGRLTPAALRRLSLGDLREALAYAATVAAVTCGRRGADPPTRAEVTA